MRKFDWLINTPISHRGLHDDKYPENSMPAFVSAMEKGYNIEIDVHLSTDGKLIVFHDADLKRVCGENILTGSLSSQDLKDHKLSNSEYTIPTLDELLNTVKGKVGILIEIKPARGKVDSTCRALYEMICNYNGDVAIQSFSPFMVKWFKVNAPEITRGMLATAYEEMKVPRIAKKAMRAMNRLFGHYVIRKVSPDFISYNIDSFPSPTLKKYKEKGMPFLTWTVKDKEHFPIAKEWADNIIFEGIDIYDYKNYKD